MPAPGRGTGRHARSGLRPALHNVQSLRYSFCEGSLLTSLSEAVNPSNW
jgi:hypothetical protein